MMHVPQAMEHDVVTLAQSLVRIPSPSGGEGAVAERVRQCMEELGYDAIEVDAWGNVIGERRGACRGPTVLFDGHMDVVDPGLERWAHEPYGGEVRQGRLWGRGAADTKGALAAMLLAAASIPVSEMSGNLIVAATVCEENLTGVALGRVLDRYPAGLVITGEPTGLHLGVSQKGRATLRIHAAGRSAHTSQPHLGENAAYKMIETIDRLRALPSTVDEELGSTVLELVELVTEPFPNQSVVPSACHARFVARTLPGETADGCIATLRDVLAGLSGVSISYDTLRQPCYTGAVLESLDFLPPWRTSPADPWRLRILTALANAGLPAETFAAPCGTNASESAGRRNIPSFIYGPGTLAQAHIADEWVAVDDLVRACTGFKAIARCALHSQETT